MKATQVTLWFLIVLVLGIGVPGCKGSPVEGPDEDTEAVNASRHAVGAGEEDRLVLPDPQAEIEPEPDLQLEPEPEPQPEPELEPEPEL